MNAFHYFFYQLGEARNFFFGAFEEQFVVDLQNHLRFEFFLGQAAVEFDHGELDQVGGGALHRRIHGGAFGEIAHVGLRRIDFRDLADAPEHSFGDAGLARFGDLTVEKFFHAAIALEIFGDEFGGFFLVNVELLREAERRKAVNHAEIDDFRDAAMLARLREWRHVKNFLRGARVDVLSAPESFCQHRILGKMRENSQFDLRVIGGKQYTARRRDECGANFAAELGAYRNILQIRIRGA